MRLWPLPPGGRAGDISAVEALRRNRQAETNCASGAQRMAATRCSMVLTLAPGVSLGSQVNRPGFSGDSGDSVT